MNRATITTISIGILTLGLTPGRCDDAAAAPEKKPEWERSAAAGLTVTRGNSKTILGTVNLAATRKWDQNELSFGADGAYGESEVDEQNEVTAKSVRGFGQYNRLFTERAFGYLRLEALHDGVAEVDYRLTFSPGAGYYFIKSKSTELSGEVGPGYITEQLDGEQDSYFVFRAAEKFKHSFNERVRVWQSAEYLPQVEDFENYLFIFEIGIESDLTKSFSLRSYIQDTYDNVPAEGRDRNDLKWVTAIAYKF